MVIDLELCELFPEMQSEGLDLIEVGVAEKDIKPCGVIKGAMLEKMMHQLDDDFNYLSSQCEAALNKAKSKRTIN